MSLNAHLAKWDAHFFLFYSIMRIFVSEKSLS